MIFKNIRLKNIRSYKETEIKFPEGAVLLAGDVGSGKTTVLLAIEYALFGLQPGQRGSSLLSNSEEYGEVSLEIDIDGIKVVIDRGLKRNAKSINQDFAAITINDIRFESSVTEVKQKIIELLNYPMDFVRKNNLVYRYTVYTPQEEMKQIIIEDTEVRLDVLRHVFGIDKYKRIQDNAQRIIMWIREESRTLQIESALLDVKRNELDSNLKFIKILESKILVKEEEIKQSKNAKEIQQKEVDSLIQLVTEKENFKKEIEKSAIMAKNKELSKKSRVFQMNFCPTCLQDVPEVHKHNIMNATESSIKEIEKNKMALASEITRIETELKKQKEDLKNLEHERITIEIQNVKQENIDKNIRIGTKKRNRICRNKKRN